MAVADYVMRDDPPPPELSRALNYQSWGAVDIMALPAGMLGKMNTCLAYYRALSAYRKASAQKQTVEFTRQNPREWELVTRILALRKERDGNRTE
jgi:hypothetical protein